MKYLIDTDILSYSYKGLVSLQRKLASLPESKISTSSISIGELYYGAYKRKSKKLISWIDKILETMEVIDFDTGSAQLAGKTKANLRRKGERLPDADIMIASIALSNDLTLVTNNTKHFNRIRGLKVENWVSNP